MPEENTQQQNGNNGNAGANGAAGQNAGDGQRDAGQQKQYADPLAAIEALNKRLQERDEELAKYKSKMDEADRIRQQQLQQNGQYEELAKSLQGKVGEYEPKVRAYDELIEEIRSDNKRRIDALPEDVRGLVPQLPPAEQRRWLDAAQSNPRFMGIQAPGLDAGAGLSGGGGGQKITVTDADRQAAEVARSQGHNITAEDIAKRRMRGKTTSASKDEN